MTIRPLHAVLLATALTAPACIGTGGSGKEATENRELEGFSEIEVAGVFKVEAQVGSSTSVEVLADDNLLPLITTKVRGDRLVVEFDGSVRPKVTPTLRVTTPKLSAIESSGASVVDARNLTGTFSFETSSASKATLVGEVDELELDVSGAAKIDASDLKAKSATVDVSGAAKVDVTVTESLDADVSGAAKVTYGGNPDNVNKDVSGAAKVEPR